MARPNYPYAGEPNPNLKGDFQQTLDLYASQITDDATLVQFGWRVACSYRDLGFLETSRQISTRLIELSKVSPDQLSMAHFNIATIDTKQGRLESALRHFRRGNETVPDDRYLPSYLHGIAGVRFMQGRFDAAVQLLNQAIDLNSQTADPGTGRRDRRYKRGLAYSLAFAGSPEESLRILGNINQPKEEAVGVAYQNFYCMAALICLRRESTLPEAATYAEQVIDIVRSKNLVFVGGEMLALSADLFRELGQLEKADALAVEAYRLSSRVGDKFVIGYLDLIFADMADTRGQTDQAGQCRDRAIRDLSALGADWLYRRREERRKVMA